MNLLKNALKITLLLILPLLFFSQISFNVKLKRNINRKIYYELLRQNPKIITLKPLCPTSFNSENYVCNWITITFTDSLSAVAILDTIQAETYEKNYSRKIDDYYKTNNLPDNYHHYLIKSYDAWKITKGSDSVIIGIIDTGIDYFHPEIKHALAVNPKEDLNNNGTFEPWLWTETKNGISGDLNNIDDDGNGYIDDVIGYDFTDQINLLGGGDYLTDDPDPYDLNSHGTIVATIISANHSDGNSLLGIAPDCKIKIMKAFAANGSAEDDDIARAIIYATKNNVQIINMSFGDIYPSQIMRDAVKYAYNQGITLIASAGNGTGQNPHYPSDFPEVIGVSASDFDPETGNEFLWLFSSYGYFIDLAAPGNSVLASPPTDSTGKVSYDYYSGTSISAPMVSATAGLLKAINKNLSPENIRTIITSTADDIMNKGWDIYTGSGRLNSLNSLKYPYGGIIKIHSTKIIKDSLQIVYSVALPLFKSYKLQYLLNSWQDITTNSSQTLKDTAFISLKNFPQGEFLIRLQVELQTGFYINKYKKILWDTTKIIPVKNTITYAWDHNIRKLYIFGKTNKKAKHQLITNNKTYQNYDKITKRYEFLYSGQTDSVALLLRSANEITTTDTFLGKSYFQKEAIPTSGLTKINSLKNGFFITPADLNNDGTQEIIMSRYDDNLQYSAIETYTLQNNKFVRTDSFGDFPALIPRGIADYDNDGLKDLLTSVYDTIIILTQKNTNSLQWKYKLTFPEKLYAVGFYDINNNGQIELWCKNSTDYICYEWNGQNFVLLDTLKEPTKDFVSSTAPIFASGDLDNDNKNEVFFKDYDGDLIIYEWENSKFILKQVIQESLVSGSAKIDVGDVNGDGVPELVSLTPSSYLRDENDFEYEPKFVKIEIVKATQNDSFKVIFRDFIYNYNSLKFNDIATINIDNDPEEEIIITVFPKFYILDYNNLSFGMKFFDYGAITSSIIPYGKDIIIGFGDSAYIYSVDSNYYFQEPLFLEGFLQDSTTAKLQWQPVPYANAYEVWRTILGDSLIYLQGRTTNDFFIQNNLPKDSIFIYTITAIDTIKNLRSKFSNFVIIKTGTFPTITSAKPISENQIEVCISSKTSRDFLIPVYFILDSLYYPLEIIPVGDSCFMLNFSDSVFNKTLCIDTLFKDFYNARVKPSCVFIGDLPADTTKFLYLTDWEILAENKCKLKFNTCLSGFSPADFLVSPTGEVVSVQKTSDNYLKLELKNVALGATGRPVIIKVRNLTGCNGETIREGFGDVAIFQENPSDLSNVYVYPNPIRRSKLYDGCYFAGIPLGAEITIYTEAGVPIKQLQCTEPTGGVFWDLSDKKGTKVPVGVYVYKVSYEGEKIIGKLAMVEN